MPFLHLDILDTICGFLTKYSDLLSLSLTCSVLHPLAIRYMLRNRPVVLQNVDHIYKFHQFVFADPATRLGHITALKIEIVHLKETYPKDSGRAIDSLLAILTRAPGLVSLELHSSAEGRYLGYLDDPRISAAVGAVPTLRELTLGGWAKTADFIGTIRAPLTKLSIRCSGSVRQGDHEWWWYPTSLSAAYPHITSSLESLAVYNSDVRLKKGLPDSLSTPAPFHALRSLTLDSFFEFPHLAPLLQLFPNLNGTLRLVGIGLESADNDSTLDEWDHTYPDMIAARKQNGSAQERRSRSWRRLERLVCGAEMFFALNLRCEIRCVVLHWCSICEDMKRLLAESLGGGDDPPPKRLNLQFVATCDTPRGELGVTGIIPPEVAATLTHLTLCIAYQHSSATGRTPAPEMQWDDLWASTTRTTSRLAFEHALPCLTHLRLVFHWEGQWNFYVPCEPWEPEELSDDPLLQRLRPASFGFAAAASALADAVPSLRYCFLEAGAWVGGFDWKKRKEFTRERWRESRAWRIVAPGGKDAEDPRGTGNGGRGLVELCSDVAKAIMVKEDLVLSVDQERAMHGDTSGA